MLLLATAILQALALLWESSSHSVLIENRIWVTLSLSRFVFVWLLSDSKNDFTLHSQQHALSRQSTDKPFSEGWPCRCRYIVVWYWQRIRDLSRCYVVPVGFVIFTAWHVVTLTTFLSIYVLAFEVFLARVHEAIILRFGGQLGAKDAANQTPAHICASATLVAVICKRDISLHRQATSINSIYFCWVYGNFSWTVFTSIHSNSFGVSQCVWSIPPSLFVM